MLIGLSAFIFLSVVAKINRDRTRINTIKIGIDDWNEIYFVRKTQVKNLIQNRFVVTGKILSGKDLENIENTVQTIPQVKKSNAYTDDNGNLNIKIEQRKPLFRVYTLQGQTFYVDNEGVKFPTTSNFTAKVPIVTGNIAEQFDSTKTIQSVELKKLFTVIQTINKNKVWQAMIGQYNINEKNQIELLPRFSSSTILFGDDKDVDKKLKCLDIFYFDVLKKIGWNYYKVINIMYKNQVVCLK